MDPTKKVFVALAAESSWLPLASTDKAGTAVTRAK
jgi:hypothetical protein